jgi:hypothetical protein
VQPFGEPPVDNNFASTLPVRAGIPNLNVWQVVTTAILMSNGGNISGSCYAASVSGNVSYPWAGAPNQSAGKRLFCATPCLDRRD